jgi:LAO/AO transport system kinase
MMFDPAPILSGQRLAIARLLTRVENGNAAEALPALFAHTGRAHLIGVTGAPGTGKSSLVNEMAKALRRAGQTVGIVAVDPSSPFTGGAILGDRIRMRDLSGDPGVFIRSMASRGALGGLARATADVVTVLDAAGFDKVIIETVGAGQSEVDIARAAHTTVVVEAPGLGDEVQGLKAGILEIADVLVLNKADTPGAELALRALRAALEIGLATGSDWTPPLVQTVAVKGEGVAEVMERIEQHRAHLQSSGLLRQRERERLAAELEARLRDGLFRQLLSRLGDGQFNRLLDKLVAREIDPATAAHQLLMTEA